jgi:hypothetical protein
MSNQVTIKRTSTFISDFDAIQRKFNRLNAKIQAVEDRQKAINDRNISTYNGKAEVCKKKRFGELQGTKVISARSPDTRYNYTVDEIKQQETDFTVHQQIFTKKKLDSNFKPISENKTFGKIKVTGLVTQEKMFRQISEVVTMAKKEDCFEIPGGAKFTTMRDSSGREITGDELEKMLSEFGASASSFISNKTEAVEAAQVKFEEIPLHYTKNFTSDYGDISIRGGYSIYSGTVSSVERESGIVLGNATVLQNATIGPRSVITKDLIVDEARQIQVVNQSTRGIGGKALDLGIAYHADITDNFSIGASISSKYILDSSDKFIEENSFLDTTLALGVGLHNFEKSFSVNMEYAYNVEDQLKPKSHGFLASMIYNF